LLDGVDSDPAVPNAVVVSNVAEGKVASQSSTVFGGDAALAVDGDTNGRYSKGSVTHTNLDIEAWWQVDLGGLHRIDTLSVWNRSDDCCSPRLSNFYIFVSDTDMTGRTLADLLNDTTVWRYYE